MRYISFNHLLLFLLFGIAAFLRTYQIEEYPLTINQDELNNIYDGWSFAETGKDRWETPNPFVLKGLGNNDYRQSGEAWLCAVVFKIFGYSVPAGRYLSSFLGLLSLWFLFLFCRKILNEQFAMIALVCAVFSPFHIQMSRMAHEGSMLPPLFLISILYTWVLAREKGYNMGYTLLLGFLIGLSVNTYRSMYVIGPLLLFPVAVDMFRQRKKFPGIPVLFLASLAGAFPQLYCIITIPEHVFERAGHVVVRPGFTWAYLSHVSGSMAENLSPVFLFLDYGHYNNLTAMRELPFQLLPFYLGLALLLFGKNKLKNLHPLYLVGVLLICVTPAAISTENPHALRSSVLCIFIPVVAAYGYWFLASFRLPWVKALITIIIVLHIVFLSYYMKLYMGNDPLRNNAHQHEMVKASRWLKSRHHLYDTIFIDNKLNSEYLYIMAFLPIAPREFQLMEKKYTSEEWIKFKQLGKFRFTNIDSLRELFAKDTSSSHLYISFQSLGTAFDSIGNIYDRTYFTLPGKDR